MLKLPKPRLTRSDNDDTFNKLMKYEKVQTMMLALFAVKVVNPPGVPVPVSDSLNKIQSSLNAIASP